MKLKDIKELEEEFNPAILVGKLKRIDAPKTDLKGKEYQIIVITDGTDELKVRIKDPKIFISTEGVGEEVELRSTIEGKNPPVGMKYFPAKEMLVMIKGASILRKINKPKSEPAQLTEVIETPEVDEVVEIPVGPLDGVIMEEFYERLHVLRVLQRENEAAGFPFTEDALFPMTTSIIIECKRSKGDKDILPPASGKKKFAAYQKVHNNPESGDTKKNASLRQDKPVEENATSSEYITKEVMKLSKLPYYNHQDLTGDSTLGQVFEDVHRRPKMIAWSFSKIGKKIPSIKLSVRDNVLALFSSLNRSLQLLVANEAMMDHIVKANGIQDYEFDNHEDPIHAKVTDKMNELLVRHECRSPHASEILKTFFTTEGLDLTL